MTARRGERDRLDELVAAAYVRKTNGSACWAARLEGEAAAFVRRVEQLVAEGKAPPWQGVLQVLVDRLGVQTSYMAVARHLRGLCACRRRSR